VRVCVGTGREVTQDRLNTYAWEWGTGREGSTGKAGLIPKGNLSIHLQVCLSVQVIIYTYMPTVLCVYTSRDTPESQDKTCL
jgi:hypothetical protein